MSEPFIGEIALFGFSYPPRGWASCNGQIINISQNTALFSVLGVNYGGDGRLTFGLPNLLDNVAVGYGQGPGLSNYSIGETGGAASVTITTSTMPAHTHSFNASSAAGRVNIPVATSAFGAVGRGASAPYIGTSGTTMNPAACGSSGGSLPHNNMMPSLALNYCIALQGIFPPRQ